MVLNDQIKMKAGEGKTLTFTIRDNDNALLDVHTATFSLAIKERKSDTTAEISKDNADFDVTDASAGVIAVNVLSTDTTAMSEGAYIMELKMDFGGNLVDLSQDLEFRIQEAVH